MIESKKGLPLISHYTAARSFSATRLDGPITKTLGRTTLLPLFLIACVLFFSLVEVRILDGFDHILSDIKTFLEIHKER